MCTMVGEGEEEHSGYFQESWMHVSQPRLIPGPPKLKKVHRHLLRSLISFPDIFIGRGSKRRYVWGGGREKLSARDWL